MSNKPRIKLPESAAKGDVIEIKTLISHVMETGQRKGSDGQIVPRNVITRFTAKFAGEPVFTADLSSGISANPFISFFMKVPGPGEFEFSWTGDQSMSVVEKLPLNVACASRGHYASLRLSEVMPFGIAPT